MDRTERFCRIETLLRRRQAVTLKDFMTDMEVSRATVVRDIEYLRDRLNWDIVWDASRRGYWLREASNAIPAPNFTSREIEALLTLEQVLRQIQPNLLGEHLEPLRTRLRMVLRQGGDSGQELSKRLRIMEPAARPTEPAQFQTISSATVQRRRLALTHVNRTTGGVTERTVSPQRLTLYRGTWYLDAWCHSSNCIRRFALDAVTMARISDEGCQEVPIEELDMVLTGGYGVFGGPAQNTAVLRFSKRVAPWVEREVWHRRQSQQREADGTLILEVPYGEDVELVMDILRYGPDVEVVSPLELRRRVEERHREGAAVYNKKEVRGSSAEPPGVAF